MPKEQKKPPLAEPEDKKENVMVEIRVSDKKSEGKESLHAASLSSLPGFKIDPEFEPVPMAPSGASLTAREETIVLRGQVDPDKIEELKNHPDVVDVWDDPKIAPFEVDAKIPMARAEKANLQKAGPCPFPPCDCTPKVAKGTIDDVVRYLGVDKIWAEGFHGEGIVIGIVDGGIMAKGRVQDGTVPNVIGGPAPDWGTMSGWGGHGNMTATDALGMAPKAHIYDLRVGTDKQTVNDLLSNAFWAFQWAIERFQEDGTPQILSCSWGIYQEAWGRRYASDPSHPFTRKVVEAIDAGIIVLMAAGNCGSGCADDRCATDIGPGRSIWGANGHPQVITVGAVNPKGEYIGYSSPGPATLDPSKPDFCSVSHFKGFFPCDSGTSAATPVAAGVAALFKQANAAFTQDQIKEAFKATATPMGNMGWNIYAGAGIIRAKDAFERLMNPKSDSAPGGK